MLDLAVAIPTLVGSILSMFAAGFIFLCYIILPPKRHFRHILILNLAFAGEFTIVSRAGALQMNCYRLFQRSKQQHFWNLRFSTRIHTCWHSLLCERVDWAMDSSGMLYWKFFYERDAYRWQATDFVILFISIATVVTLRKSNYKANTHWSAKVLVTMGIWVVPTITSTFPPIK